MERTIATPQARTREADTGDHGSRTTLNAVLSFLVYTWQKLRAGIWSARTRLSSDITRPLDIEQIAERLCVLERAQEDGRRNLPPPDEAMPAGTQREIIAFFIDLRRRAHQQLADAIDNASRTLEQLRESDALARLRDIPARCESRILRHVTDVESRLQHVVERERSQKQHYEAFREKNQLDRVATYPEYAQLYYLVVPFLIVALAYVLANWILPDEKSGVSATWIGAVSAAIIIVPFAFGSLALRAIGHIDDFTAFAGWIGCIVALASIGGIAFYADFHIAAVLADPNVSSDAIFGAMRAAPFDVITGVASWTTFGLIVLMGLNAMFLGYHSDDSYPGYGAVQRAYYEARGAREAVSLRLRKHINTLVDEAEAEAASIIKGYKARLRAYKKMAQTSAQFPSTLNDYDVELEDSCNILLDRYRAANSAARSSGTPMSFAEHVCFYAEGSTTAARQGGVGNKLEDLQVTLADLENEANSARQKLRAMNLRMIGLTVDPQAVDTDS
jgi:hypothetical protein